MMLIVKNEFKYVKYIDFVINFNIYGLTGIVLGSLLYSFPVELLMFYDVSKY